MNDRKMSNTVEKTFCGVCNKTIKRNQSPIACISCLLWSHLTCNGLKAKDVGKKDITKFNCIACVEKNRSCSKRRGNKEAKVSESTRHEKIIDSFENETMQDEILPEKDVKVESGSDGEFEEFEGYDKYSEKLSEFELIRLENIKKNQKMFEQFDINAAKENLVPKKRKREVDEGQVKLKKEKKELEVLPLRKSVRIQNIQTETVEVKNPAQVSFRYDASVGNSYFRKPSKIEMKTVNDVEGSDFELTVKSWLESDIQRKKSKSNDKRYSDLNTYQKNISSWTVTDITKVTMSRAYSATWYPSKNKKVTCCGDKKGTIGIWDIDHSKEKNSVFLFDVHSGPVSCLAFSPFDQSKLYSCSYDGTLTCGDMNMFTFSQQYTAADDRTCVHHFAWPHQQRNTLLLSTSDGEIIILDLSSHKVVKRFRLSNQQRSSARCVDCHPLNENVFATSSANGTLATWDMRNIKKHGSKSLSSAKAGKAIVKSFFSPLTGNKLLMTSQDHYLRIFDVNKSGIIQSPPRHQIKHENYYGRWLTTFRAMWDPKTDYSFVCGSMAKPRRIDLFGCDEKKKEVISYTLHDENLSFISSVNVFHPQLDMLASCNSSGKMYIWS